MVYIHSWQEFQDAAEALYVKSPNKARYVVKWKSAEGKLVLKITDDTTCIKFKTFSSIFLNRFETLNLCLIQKMQNRRKEEQPKSTAEQPAPAVESATEPAASAANIQSAPTASGVTKKKKPKKKK
ncbi:Signal recognition particle 9 kDa protein [Leucoagaricus sp. SymC.cos]|nr:Signal recognition particle 9 kDa protein [Leucoagaricus sp. SymC.cos]